jgi:hypothetical protein
MSVPREDLLGLRPNTKHPCSPLFVVGFEPRGNTLSWHWLPQRVAFNLLCYVRLDNVRGGKKYIVRRNA